MKKVIGYINFGIFLGGLFFTPVVFAEAPLPMFCNNSTTVIQTAIGCVDTTPNGLMQKVFAISLGIGGGIAFLMILLGALQIQTSAGNPERVNGGREMIEGAITGLLLIILSIFILKVVGVDILGIPGFK